jgi:hypothetical protein
MTASSAWYRLLAAGGGEVEAGDGEVSLTGGVLELRPAVGAALRVPSARIASVAEPAPFTVLVTLSDGTAVELSRLGRMRSELLEDLRDARAEVAAAESGAVGDSARFSGTVAASPVDLHVFEDALLVVGGGQARRFAFAFAAGVRVRDYTVTVDLGGGGTLDVTRLGRRTGEFAALLGERLREARNRTSAFLGSLLPGLDPMALRAAAGLLRDGVAVTARALDAVHPDLSVTLLRVATRPGRLAAVSAVAGRAELAIGFKQVASVRQAAVGVTAWQDPSVTPHTGDHGAPGGRFGPGLGGMLGAGLMSGLGPGGGYGGPFGGGPAGYGGLGGYWAFGALGALGGGLVGGGGGGWGGGMTPRADVSHGLLTPETEDLAALTVAGDDPTVLAFALFTPVGGGDPVAYEVLNLDAPATYVYRAGGADPRARVNQALDDAGFAAADIHAGAAGDLAAPRRQDVASSPLAGALTAEVRHDDAWAERLAGLLRG